MNNWGILAGLGLLAMAFVAVAYIRYRQRESSSLMRDVELARGLRDLAGDDAVRLACVDEFEVGLYQRLFYASAVGPRLRSAVWSTVGAVFAVTAALLLRGVAGALADVCFIVALVVAFFFGLAVLCFLSMAAFAALTTPRVSFAESYGATADDATD
ncbi:hypothetical protein [Gordonia sp. FQ]|uniref:hypothetical protein n=1 Tax=Gordonia sp. FQ TaxID=3446634 RepID=UPI003F831048